MLGIVGSPRTLAKMETAVAGALRKLVRVRGAPTRNDLQLLLGAALPNHHDACAYGFCVAPIAKELVEEEERFGALTDSEVASRIDAVVQECAGDDLNTHACMGWFFGVRRRLVGAEPPPEELLRGVSQSLLMRDASGCRLWLQLHPGCVEAFRDAYSRLSESLEEGRDRDILYINAWLIPESPGEPLRWAETVTPAPVEEGDNDDDSIYACSISS